MADHDAATPGALVGTWHLVAVGATPAVDDVSTTITFAVDGTVAGLGGVNRFAGTYRLEGSTVELGPLRATLMAGPEPAMRQEGAVFATLDGSLAFTVAGEVLTLGTLQWQRARDDLTVSGEVTYRQKIALPPNAVLRVEVADVSRDDAPSVTVAADEKPIPHQVPIPFRLTIAQADLDLTHRYGVSARITVGGHLAWISDTHHPVATDASTEVTIPLTMVRDEG